MINFAYCTWCTRYSKWIFKSNCSLSWQIKSVYLNYYERYDEPMPVEWPIFVPNMIFLDNLNLERFIKCVIFCWNYNIFDASFGLCFKFFINEAVFFIPVKKCPKRYLIFKLTGSSTFILHLFWRKPTNKLRFESLSVCFRIEWHTLLSIIINIRKPEVWTCICEY